MRRSLQWLQPTGAYLWRLLGGVPPENVPRTDAGWFTPGHQRPPRDTAPRPPSNPLTEILWDFREIRAEWREARVRRALGAELREVERQVLAGHDAGES
jgi:hypothetical protein